jgi:DHA3 family macrolide efflux protein-like MFS transporter
MNSLRTFYILIFSQIFSLIGSHMTGVAIGLWIFGQTGDASPLLIAAFFAEVPQMAGGIFTGLLADKWDRRYVMMLGDAGQALGTILLLMSILTGNFQLWIFYTVMLLQGIFKVIQEPAAEASIAQLVPENHLDRANGIRQIGFPLAGVVAPALAGLVYALAGLQGVIAIDLLTFLVAIGVVFSLRLPKPKQSDEGLAASESFTKELLAGLNFLWQRKALFVTVIYLAFLFFLMNGPLEMSIPYMSSVLKDEWLVGIMLALFNGGAFAGAALVAVLGKVPHRMLWILLGYVLHGVLMIAYGLSRNPWMMGLAAFGMMFPLPLAGALFNSVLQTKTPSDMQGRVFGVTGQIWTLTTPFSFLITAWLVDNWLEPAVKQSSWAVLSPYLGSEDGAGMGLLLVIVGAMILLTSLVMLAWRGARELEERLPSYQAEAVAGD